MLFSSRRQRGEALIIIACDEVAQTDPFRYLGWIIRNNGKREEDITNKLKASLLKMAKCIRSTLQ